MKLSEFKAMCSFAEVSYELIKERFDPLGIGYTSLESLVKHTSCASAVLQVAFYWHQSDEGWGFWSNVCRYMENIEALQNPTK